MDVVAESVLCPFMSFSGSFDVVDQSVLCPFMSFSGSVDGVALGSTLPASLRNRLADLFGQIVQEFEILYAENETLHQRLGEQSDRLQGLSDTTTTGKSFYKIGY